MTSGHRFGAGPCPCGGTTYDVCCGPLHRGEAHASTAEQLMRSRFSAYSMGEFNYVFRTWHPRTRPSDVEPSPGHVWLDLVIVDVVNGQPEHDSGVVEFKARFETDQGVDVLHERSNFSRRAGHWMYVDGLIDPVNFR